MRVERRQISLGFTDEIFEEGLHICYIFRDEEERRSTMAKYMNSGLETGEKVLYLVDTMSPGEFLDHMAELGLRIGERTENLIVSEALPTYCPAGYFSTPEMLDVVGKFYQQAMSDGYVGARGTGEMSWCLVEGCARKEDLMEYEARLTQTLRIYPYTACCQYDARRFDGATIMDVLSVHPLMIVRGQLVRNPFFVEPEVFIEEIRKRSACE